MFGIYLNLQQNVLKVKLTLLVFSFVLLVMQKVQKWRVLIYRVIVKQHAKREQTHPVYLHAMEKYKKVESVNIQKDLIISKR